MTNELDRVVSRACGLLARPPPETTESAMQVDTKHAHRERELDSREGGSLNDLSAKSAALTYRRSGLSIIPIWPDGSKAPTQAWKQFQKRLADPSEFDAAFANGAGVGIVCGAISQLEVIDFDAEGLFDDWCALVRDSDPQAFAHVSVVQTPRGYGRHVYLRRLTPARNQVLAARPTNSAGSAARTTLIETRGEGGYVLAPGCPADCHPTKGLYVHLDGPKIEDLRSAPPVSDETYARMIDAARALNEMSDEAQLRDTPRDREQVAQSSGDDRPGDDFNLRATWSEVLAPFDWELVRSNGSRGHWRRPSKEGPGTSATTGYCTGPKSGELLYVFSSNAAPFEARKSYSKFAAYAILNHGGDYVAAARELARHGYGQSLSAREELGERQSVLGDRHDEHDRDDPRPVIRIVRGELPVAADAAERALLDEQNPIVFQRRGALVRVVEIEKTSAARAGSDQSGAATIRPVDDAFLLDQLAQHARFERVDRKGLWTRCDPPLQLARTLLSRSGAWSFPVLRGVVDAPQLFNDGSVLESLGYDAKSGLLMRSSGTRFPPIPTSPTRQDAVAALALLNSLLDGFPFVDASDRSAALAKIISAVARSAFRRCPAFGVTAPTRASGKSTLLNIGATLATGRHSAVIEVGVSAEEADKRILSVLQDGIHHVAFDNLSDARQLDVPPLAKAITELEYTGRTLGSTGTATYSTQDVLWTFGGVNIAPQGDILSRSILIRLDLQTERPLLYEWTTPDPSKLIEARRGEFVVAALTVLRAYIHAGRPDQGLQARRFEEWSALVRSALVWLDLPDPMAGQSELELQDPEFEALYDLAQDWSSKIGEGGTMTRDALCRLSPDVLSNVAVDRHGQIKAAQLGHFLKKFAGRVVDGRRFLRVGDAGSRALWSLRSVTLAPSTPSPGTPRETTETDISKCVHAEVGEKRCTRCEGAYRAAIESPDHPERGAV